MFASCRVNHYKVQGTTDEQAVAIEMLSRCKACGYLTYYELNAVLPPDELSSTEIENALKILNEMGINVVES